MVATKWDNEIILKQNGISSQSRSRLLHFDDQASASISSASDWSFSSGSDRSSTAPAFAPPPPATHACSECSSTASAFAPPPPIMKPNRLCNATTPLPTSIRSRQHHLLHKPQVSGASTEPERISGMPLLSLHTNSVRFLYQI
ncbi:hypothetical protein L2E82_25228 [Cichorium intybus]|uniref:Uncharacterized protein n=1 Tax=Cichorium intybus TaxID=13427 RepID=A0ACB9E305_CICIN|nr:hypothetical protein L2E82_25228 [Cichorium intybus]